MRDYGKVSTLFWTRGSGKRLRGDPEAQLVALYLVTNPWASSFGVYYLPIAVIANDTGSPFEGASEALARVIQAGFAKYDLASELVWVPNLPKLEIGSSLSGGDKRKKHLQEQLEKLGNHPFAVEFFDVYGADFGLTEPKPLRSPFDGPWEPLRSQKQKQKQDQIQNTGSFSKQQIALTEVVSAEFDSRGISESAPRVSAKPKRSAAEQEAAKLVKDAFHAGYRKRYGRPITGWGGPQNAHIYHLLKTWPAHELATLAVAYFAWPRSGPIEAGHPFMGNPKSFSANLEALHADTFKADRRVEAAGIRQQDRDFDVRAANESTLDRVFTKLGAQENGKLEPATGSEQQRLTAAQTGNLFAHGRAQPEDVGGGDDALGQEAVSVCKGKGTVGCS